MVCMFWVLLSLNVSVLALDSVLSKDLKFYPEWVEVVILNNQVTEQILRRHKTCHKLTL